VDLRAREDTIEVHLLLFYVKKANEVSLIADSKYIHKPMKYFVTRKRTSRGHMGWVLSLLVPIWCRRKSNMYSVTRKRTSRGQTRSQSKQQTLRKKKPNEGCFACGSDEHWHVLSHTTNLSEKIKSQ